MKTMKRIVSILLAMLMIVGSVSTLAYAAAPEWTDSSSSHLNDGNENTVRFTTKYYRYIGENSDPYADPDGWIETSKVAPGEHVKARVFVESDFYFGGTMLFWLYDKTILTAKKDQYTPSIGNMYVARVNKAAGSQAVELSYDGDIYLSDEPIDTAEYLIEMGYLSESDFDQHGFAFFMTGPAAKIGKLTADNWLFEFDFTVKSDLTEDQIDAEGLMYIPQEACITPDDTTWDAIVYIAACPEEFAGLLTSDCSYPDAMENYDYDFNIENGKSTVSASSKITFNANGGTLAGDATTEGIIKTAATAPAVTAPAGSEFIGWVPAGMELTEENVVTTFAYDYEDTAYTALYTAAAPTTAKYTVNVYEMGKDGTYGAPVVETPDGNIGEEVTYAPTVNEGFYLDAAQSTLTTTVAADGSAVINAYIARNKMIVNYLDENGEAIDGIGGEYYYGSTYTLAPAIEKKGYDWAGWEAGKEVEVLPATDGETVTYNAGYVAGDNKVVINAYYDDAMLGGTVDLAPYTVATKTGYTVKIVNEIPAEPEANVTYVLKSELPAAEHYEVDADAEYTVAVKDDGTATLEIAYVSKTYTITFLDADGEVLYTGKHNYFDTVDAPGAPDLSDIGQLFEVWTVVSGAGEDLADEYGSIDVVGDVTYQASYAPVEYIVFYASEEIDGYDAPSLEDMGLEEEGYAVYGEEIVLPTFTDEFTGYEFLGYEVYGADYDEATNTVTIGAEDVDIIAKWDMIEYTVSYYLTDDTTAEPYEVIEYHYGDEIEDVVPEQHDILGQKFLGWTYTPALEDGTMPASSVIAIMDAEPYVVTFYNADGSIAAEKSAATITADDAAAAQAAATPANTTFVEWRDASGKAIAFPVDVMDNLEVYAYCTADVIFMVNDTVYETVKVGYGEAVTAPEIAADYLDGYTITGWSEIPATITENTTVSGR